MGTTRTELVQRLADIEPGNHLALNRQGIYHHHCIVIEVDEDTELIHVIEYSNDKLTFFGNAFNLVIYKAEIKESQYAYAKGKFTKIVHSDAGTPEQIVMRARSRIGEKKYNAFYNNCEHVAHWCVTGKSHSSQVYGGVIVSTKLLGSSAALKSWQIAANISALKAAERVAEQNGIKALPDVLKKVLNTKMEALALAEVAGSNMAVKPLIGEIPNPLGTPIPVTVSLRRKMISSKAGWKLPVTQKLKASSEYLGDIPEKIFLLLTRGKPKQAKVEEDILTKKVTASYEAMIPCDNKNCMSLIEGEATVEVKQNIEMCKPKAFLIGGQCLDICLAYGPLLIDIGLTFRKFRKGKISKHELVESLTSTVVHLVLDRFVLDTLVQNLEVRSFRARLGLQLLSYLFGKIVVKQLESIVLQLMEFLEKHSNI